MLFHQAFITPFALFFVFFLFLRAVPFSVQVAAADRAKRFAADIDDDCRLMRLMPRLELLNAPARAVPPFRFPLSFPHRRVRRHSTGRLMRVSTIFDIHAAIFDYYDDMPFSDFRRRFTVIILPHADYEIAAILA